MISVLTSYKSEGIINEKKVELWLLKDFTYFPNLSLSILPTSLNFMLHNLKL
jgi:hypothetical protein